MTAAGRIVLALDFGGTKLAAGLVDVESGKLLEAAHIPTQAAAGATQVVADMIDLAQSLAGIAPLAGIGVSFGGHVRRGELLRSLHVEGWPRYPLREQLREQFAVDTVEIANDANAIALGEWCFGAGKGADSLLYVTVSTGIGGGIVVGGRILEGARGMAGEIGHMPIDPDGPLCTCGSRGCLEALAAGPAIVRSAREMLDSQPGLVSALRQMPDFTAKTVGRWAQQGDAVATEVVAEAGRTLGRAIASTLILLDVERVVIGGGIARSGDVWWHAVIETINTTVLPWNQPIDVRRSGLGEFEGVLGAAALLAQADL